MYTELIIVEFQPVRDTVEKGGDVRFLLYLICCSLCPICSLLLDDITLIELHNPSCKMVWMGRIHVMMLYAL